jgi:hypothetical protein
VYTPLLRLVLIVGCLILGAVGLRGGFWWGWLWIISATLFAVGYWRAGTVWLACRALRKGHLARAERLLAQVRTPSRLSPQQRAYYELAQGDVHRAREDIPVARRHFRAAAEGRLRTTNDRALAYSRLAETELTARDFDASRAAIANARALRPSPLVEALLRDLEEAMGRDKPPAGGSTG